VWFVVKILFIFCLNNKPAKTISREKFCFRRETNAVSYAHFYNRFRRAS
jgi:hypothetical protein